MSGPGEAPSALSRDTGWRIAVTGLILLGVFALAFVVWRAVDVVLLLFGAVLVANALRAPTDALSRHTGMRDGLALAITSLLVLLIVSVMVLFLVPQISAQVPELLDNLSDTITQLNRRLGLGAVVEQMANGENGSSALPAASGLLGEARSLISTTFGALTNVVILTVVGIYLAADPKLYFDGAVRLFPKERRDRARHTLGAIGRTLRWWIIGQVVAMTVVGILSFVGLTLIGVPLALALAVLAFLTNFVPFIGPIISGLPAVLVGFSQGADTAFWVLMLYIGIQSFEGYFLTPMIQREAVSLPPALTIAAQVVFGVLFGALGVIFATPLAAAGLVAVRILYVEGALGDEDAKDASAET